LSAPAAFSSDKHTLFRVANQSKEVRWDNPVRAGFERVLNIEILCGATAQAKGRPNAPIAHYRTVWSMNSGCRI
jgi:hypothetical protein